jgi:class 3 adenylate cyclase
MEQIWGSGFGLLILNPAVQFSPEMQQVAARVEHAAGTPRRSVMKQRFVLEVDVRDVLPAIAVPTLVAQSRENPQVRTGHGRYLAEHIRGARYLEVAGGHWPWMTEDAGLLMDEIESFVREATGTRGVAEPDRVLMTVAFTDIVGSTEMAARIGDRRWRELLEVHDSVGRREVGAARGRVVKSTGDGLLATFDGPARAVQAVEATERALEPVGLQVRGGVHCGEVELRGDDVGGIAVHTAARVASLAGPGEVLVSQTVRDLVAGSGLAFEDRGLHRLKGVPGDWRLFALSR